MMNKLILAISLGLLASILPACKKNMPPVVAPRWSAIEDLARAAGPICDRVLAMPKCPIEPDGLAHPEAGPEASLPSTPLVGATEVRDIEVFCEPKDYYEVQFARSCYLQRYFDPHGPQRSARFFCGRNKPYPGWERSKDGLAYAYDDTCKENLYHAWIRRKSPAGNTVQAGVYFYVDGHPPAAPPTPSPQ